MLINVPICLRNLGQTSGSLAKYFGWVLVDCRLVVRIRPEQASQDFGVQWLFVKSKSIVCVNVLYGDKKKSFCCSPHARQMEYNCVAELTVGLLEPDRPDWDSFIYI